MVGLSALLMGGRGLEVAFKSMVESAQAFPCLQCWWLWICRAELGQGQLVGHPSCFWLLGAGPSFCLQLITLLVRNRLQSFHRGLILCLENKLVCVHQVRR